MKRFTALMLSAMLLMSASVYAAYGDGGINDDGRGPDEYEYEYDNKLPFDDVSEDVWYYDSVKIAYDFGIISGKSDTKFDPNAGMTVAEAAKIAATIRLVNSEDYDESYFANKTGEHWYDIYVDYCYNNDIIERDMTFDWDKPATRGEMAYFFSRAYNEGFYLNEDVPITDIPDVNSATPYSYEILDLYRRGIAVGSDALYTFHPNDGIKRSEAAAFIARILAYDLRIELPKG